MRPCQGPLMRRALPGVAPEVDALRPATLNGCDGLPGESPSPAAAGQAVMRKTADLAAPAHGVCGKLMRWPEGIPRHKR